MEVGAIGEFVVKPVEMEISQELVQTQHRNLEELIVQAIQLRIVGQKNALVNTLYYRFRKIKKYLVFTNIYNQKNTYNIYNAGTYSEYIQLTVVGAIGETVVKLVEVELSPEVVPAQNQSIMELNVQANQLRIVTHRGVLVIILSVNKFWMSKLVTF